jgi:hypothetical protein
MSRHISESLRKIVIIRANYRCEYCRIHAYNSFLAFHIEHIISLKHGGKTIAENLAYSCSICNLNKGTDISTFINDDVATLIRFFNPRTDVWADHFSAESSGLLVGKTQIGAATIKIFNLNHPDSIVERREMITKGIFD